MELIKYYINKKLINDLGIYVSQSSGVTDLPKAKETVMTNWPNEHGLEIDLEKRVFEARSISLNCFMMCENEEDFTQKSLQLNNLFNSNKLIDLIIKFSQSSPLVYMVYLSGGITHNKKWRNGKFVSTFQIELTEPEPMKMTFISTIYSGIVSFEFSVTNDTLINIYWIGENYNEVEKDVLLTSTNNTITHSFISSKTDQYNYIIITGNINDLKCDKTENCKLLTQGI